jgi:hypothetical protein
VSKNVFFKESFGEWLNDFQLPRNQRSFLMLPSSRVEKKIKRNE